MVIKEGQEGSVILRLVGLFIAATGLVLFSADSRSVPTLASPSNLAERQRFGFVATSYDWRHGFDAAQLGAGWYVEHVHSDCVPTPSGMERAALITVNPGYTVNPNSLGPIVDKYPGVIWLIGNEPDCLWQDNVVPEDYARIYHDLYSFIKNRDPSSQIAPGGIVQPTPLRFEWLDRVLAAYQAAYGGGMPVDVWNIHNMIVSEVRAGAGAGIPPGIDVDVGVLRDAQDNDNMEIFTDQIWAFRHWMADNGYDGHPLIVTEYGILMPADWYGFDVERVNNFMSATFAFFQTATSAELGDPTDGYRLVQRWAWFSLDFPPFDPETQYGFNGNLFDPETKAITDFGLHYAGHTTDLSSLEHVDLRPGILWGPPSPHLGDPTQTFSQSIEIEVLNEGTLDSRGFTVRLEYDGPQQAVLEQTVVNVSPASSHWLSFTLSSLPQGTYDLSVWIDSHEQVAESTECNNLVTSGFAVPPYVLYFPWIAR